MENINVLNPTPLKLVPIQPKLSPTINDPIMSGHHSTQSRIVRRSKPKKSKAISTTSPFKSHLRRLLLERQVCLGKLPNTYYELDNSMNDDDNCYWSRQREIEALVLPGYGKEVWVNNALNYGMNDGEEEYFLGVNMANFHYQDMEEKREEAFEMFFENELKSLFKNY